MHVYKTLQLNEVNFILRKKKGITLFDRDYSFYKIRVHALISRASYTATLCVKDFGQRVVQCMLHLLFFVTGIKYRVVLFL